MSATIEKAVQLIESTQEADGSRYVWCGSCADFFPKRQNSNGDIHRIRRRNSKPGANRLGIDRPREIRSVFTALRN
ncbi:unnamed protein product [Brassica rapa]|uniref:Uncharacterized protein n=1 Tax=Brassica campestris TaxID=3711 RepID=A0A3P6BEZ7_BRACM|nr:unnamed protein product [Brassica rapa]VDC96420.1 unnamed protein product [Brassica rapa]